MNSPLRGRYQGVLQIVRFNWPMYLTAAIVLIAGSLAAISVPVPKIIRATILAGFGFAAFWLIVSLLVSHYVYDRAALYEGEWLAKALRCAPMRYATLHVGLDEFSEILRAIFPNAEGSVIDFFDAAEMTEPSILRARKEHAANLQESVVANFCALPLADNQLDVAFLIFAAHELRKADSRSQLFRELRRALKSDGRIVLVEHLRDFPNFLAFGPGVFHFHSRAAWLRNFSAADLFIAKEFGLTPFVRGFILEKTFAGV